MVQVTVVVKVQDFNLLQFAMGVVLLVALLKCCTKEGGALMGQRARIKGNDSPSGQTTLEISLCVVEEMLI